jgi:uncharacterized protein (TIGR03435 family)
MDAAHLTLIFNIVALPCEITSTAPTLFALLDRTGLTGTFDFSLEWFPERDITEPPDQPATSGPGFQEALQRQLGFRLVATTAPQDILVIDHIERPDDN